MPREVLPPRDVREDFRNQVQVPQWAVEYAQQAYAPRPVEYQRPQQLQQQQPFYQGGYGWSDYRRDNAWGQNYQPQVRPNYGNDAWAYQQLPNYGNDAWQYQQRPNYGNDYSQWDQRNWDFRYRQGNQNWGRQNFPQPDYGYGQRFPYDGGGNYPYNPGRPDWGYQPGDGYPQPGQPYRQPYYGNVPYRPNGRFDNGAGRYYDQYQDPRFYQQDPRFYQQDPRFYNDGMNYQNRRFNDGRFYQNDPRFNDGVYYPNRNGAYMNDGVYRPGRDRVYMNDGVYRPGNDFGQLRYAIATMVGHSVREYDPRVPETLGCAAFVSAALRKGYGMNVRDTNVKGLEHTLRRSGFQAVPINQAQPGDVVIGHRYGNRAGHAAIYVGGDQIANNSSGKRRIVVDGIGKFFGGDFRSVVAYRKMA